jgi:hypothetical protein
MLTLVILDRGREAVVLGGGGGTTIGGKRRRGINGGVAEKGEFETSWTG